MNLREKIAQEIRVRGPMPFSRYMELCLYDPEFGYYAQPREQFGKAGDFYTSSDVHAVFGRLLCRQFEEMWRALDSPAEIDVVELGPGRGLFARDVLDWARKTFPEFARALRYRLVEISSNSRRGLGERLANYVSTGHVKVYSSLDDCAEEIHENVIVFGNEFFDALPVEIITCEGAVRVSLNAQNELVETFAEPLANELEYLDRYSVHPEDGQRVEASLVAREWVGELSRFAGQRRAFLVFVDYGYTREEQLRGRHLDTLLTYRQHTTSNDPYEAPGQQDITAHVNFTMLKSVFEDSGIDVHALVTQAEFLMGIGEPNNFDDAFSGTLLPQERAKVALQLKHLVTPAGMGEIFQVLVMSRGVAKEKAARLSGLKFSH
jgi:SAM-dependent MidA family methyltransferase